MSKNINVNPGEYRAAHAGDASRQRSRSSPEAAEAARRINVRSRSIARLGGEIAGTLGAYVAGQIRVSLAMSGLYAVGFALLSVPLWPLVALACGFLNLVPYFGGLIALGAAMLATWAGGGELWRIGAVAGIYGVVQALETPVLTPRILGRRLRMRPRVVFLALLAGGTLFGFVGLLLAVPALAVAMAVWKFFQDSRTEGQAG